MELPLGVYSGRSAQKIGMSMDTAVVNMIYLVHAVFFIRILFIRIIRLKSEKNKNYLRIMFRLRSWCGTVKSRFFLVFSYLCKN